MSTATPPARTLRRPCAALALCLAGCAAGPEYSRPELPAMTRYTESAQPPALAAVEGDPTQRWLVDADLPARWWALFGSRSLDELVRSALERNPTVTGAQAALRAARENVLAQQAAFFPTASASYAATRQKVPAALASPASSAAELYNLHTAQVSVAYAPDVFGANRRLVQSLQAQADTQRWAVEATYLTLTSSLVQAAVQQASLRAQIDATKRLVDIQRQLLDRFRHLQTLGQVAELDVAQQAAALAATETTLPPLQVQLAQQSGLIKALAGRLPADALEADFTLDALTLPQELPLTLPSTLVEHRPDVLAAESQLRAASAAIGVAAAARLPSVSLGVDAWGSSAYNLGDLFKAGSGFWTLSANVSQTLFDAGALRHREAAARAAYDQAVAQYRSTVISAFQNVADTLQAIAGDAQTLASTRRARDAAERSLAIARRQLELGDASALAVMQSEQAALQASIGVVQARAARLADTVALFQALGGGWWNREPATAAAPQPGR